MRTPTPPRSVSARLLLILALLVGAGPPAPAVPAEAALWDALREGRAVALIRHALAPGTGDPAGFRLDDCTTQRNLSDEGRAQARALGARFRANGITSAEVHSSQWCRSLETARLLALGPVQEFPALNSFFADRSSGSAQSAAIERFLEQGPAGVPRVLVTHQVNITALTGVFPSSGEIVVVAPDAEDGLAVLGRLATSP
jgi:phosphohistidine phosphatase SixA